MTTTFKKEKLIELDYPRVISMLSVIIIHATSTFIYAQSSFTIAGMNPAFILNQATRFAVPLFILLSGLSLGFSRSGTSYLAFLKSRCAKLLLPYIIWNLLHWLYYFRGYSPGHLAKSLLLGSSASHLYFIVVLFQLYLLYPLLKKLVGKHPIPTLLGGLAISLISHLLIQGTSLGRIPSNLFIQLLWELFPTWMFYFTLGMVIFRFGIEKLCAWCGKHLWVLLPVTVVFALWFVYDAHLTQSLDAIKLSLFFFTPLILLTSLAIGHRARHFVKWNRLIAFLAAHSQTVFFCHILVLEFLRHIPFLVTGMRGMFVLLIPEILLSVAAAWCIDTLVSKAKGILKKS